MSDADDVTVMPVNCEQLKEGDIHKILENVLYEFPVTDICCYIPSWVEMLDNGHWLKQSVIETVVLIGVSIRQFYYMRHLFEIKGSL